MNGLAASVREYLQTTLQEQFSWSSAEDAFKHWRRAVEAAGVFVFKRALKQKGISGFCLHDETFPLVVVNNSTAHAKQSFTLFHELCHLLFAVGGITKDDDRFVVSMAGVDREIEVACNHFAAEVLVPSGSFPWNELRARGLDDAVEAIAGQYRVSREVILRRLLDAGEVDEAAYEERVAAWNEQYNAARAARGGGGDYYATQATYLGEGFLRLAFGQYYAGQLTLPQLAGHLGMKAKNVPRLQDFVLGAR
jgi:Zn-dependent peptidase ImmA (M78 family)